MPGQYPPRQRSAISWRNWSTSAGNVVPSSQSRRCRVLGCSSLGSFAVVHDPAQMESLTPSGLEEAGLSGALYQASKSAVNMLTVQYARQLPNIRINVVDPGYTATDLNAHDGTQTLTEGTDAMVAMATIGVDGPTGTFTDRHGAVAW